MQRHFFELILQHTTESAKEVREMVLNDKSLLAIKYRPLNDAGEQSIHYPLHLELEAYKFLGAYIGSVTAVQLCLLVGDVELAKDLIDRTVAKESLDIQCGGGNTALHLAAFFNYPTVCKTLIDAGADSSIKVSL